MTGAITAIVRWLEILAIGIFTFDTTGSPIVVSFLLLARMLPMSIVGFWIPLLSERMGPKPFLQSLLIAITAVSLTLAWLVFNNKIETWHLILGVFFSGCLQASDMPVRRILLGETAGFCNIGAAMSLDSSTNHITRVIGPMIGGVLIVTIGLKGVFLLSSILYMIAVGLISLTSLAATPNKTVSLPIMRNLAEGIRLVRENRSLVGILLITVVYNVCGFPFLSMIPVIGKDILGLNAIEIGLLAGAEGLGAFAGSMFLAIFARSRWFFVIYTYGTVLAIITILLFGMCETIGLAAAIIPFIGLGGAGFSSMQSAIIFLSAPPHLRGRLMGVVAFCIGISPIGYLQLGYLAAWYGPSTAVVIVALEGLFALALIILFWPELYRQNIEDVESTL